MYQRIQYHTRHIPSEHLNFSVEMARKVRENGLCDVLEPENIEYLKRYGIETVELRLVWREMEPNPGNYAWSRFERDLERVEQAGLKAGLMAWFNHPPEWYLEQTSRASCFKCLEHGRESSTLSLWDPETLRVKDRLYGMVAKRYGSRLDFIYATFSGDYGEPMLPTGVRHYKFSSPHSHGGVLWSGDSWARKSWRCYLRKHYSSLEALNHSWKTTFNSWDDDLLCDLAGRCAVSPRRRIDYMRWITDSTADYAKKVYALIRKHFPRIRTGIPIGSRKESGNGQQKALCIKKISEVDSHFTARWTGMAVLGEFSSSNVLARRVSSAAMFYGANFGEEAALMIEADNGAAAFYEGISNGMSILHNDIGNIKRSEGVIDAKAFGESVRDIPLSSVMLFYPAEQEMLKVFDADYNRFLKDFIAKSAGLRHKTDYHVCDSVMIADGCLADKTTLVFVVSCFIFQDTVEYLEKFISAGGKIIVCCGADVTVFETGQKLKDVIAPTIMINILPEFPDYQKLKRSPDEFITLHEHHVSRFHPGNKTFTMEPRA